MTRVPSTGRVPTVGRSAQSKRFRLQDFKTSLFFSGTKITIPTVVPSTSGFSCAFWYYKSSNGNSERMIDCTDSSTANGFLVFQGSVGNNDKVQFSIRNGSTQDAIITSGSLRRGAWYHVAVTFAPNSAKMYINGVLQGTDTSCAMTTPAEDLTIGGASGSDLNSFNSYLDNVIFKNGTPWTQEEVENIYYKVDIPSSTTFFFELNETVYDTVATDLSGNSNTGVISIGGGRYVDFHPYDTRVVRDFSLLPAGNSYDIIIIAGQSNAGGRAVTSTSSYHPTLQAALFGNDYQYKFLTDPTDSDTNQVDTVSSDTGAGGSVWPLVASNIMRSTGRPVLFVPCAKGASSITEWQPGADHQDRSTLYGSMVYRALQAQAYGTIKAVVWWQGESDALAAMSQATYNSYLDTVANNVMTDLGVKLVPCKLQNSTSIPDANELAINDAIGEAWADNVNVVAGPDLNGISTAPDGIHLTTNAQINTASNLWWTALNGTIF